MKERTLDELDIRILKELSDNCRNPINNIAKKLQQPKSTIHYRIRRLEELGIIQGCLLRVDEAKLGWEYHLITLVYARYRKGNLSRLADELGRLPYVWAVYRVLGDADFIVMSKHRNSGEVREFLEKLGSVEGIDRVSSHVVLEPVKEDPTVVVRELREED